MPNTLPNTHTHERTHTHTHAHTHTHTHTHTDHIEANVETAAIQVEQGNKQLVKAVKHKVRKMVARGGREPCTSLCPCDFVEPILSSYNEATSM